MRSTEFQNSLERQKKMSDSADKCPVDHEAREKWMSLNKHGPESGKSCPVDHSSMNAPSSGCSSDKLDHPSATSTSSSSSSKAKLSREREISSIPRGDTGKNWVYPSQQQFFNSMRRKNFDPNAQDMQTIIPIHNAVNERTWMEILKWEEGQGADKCGGPTLVRFEGDASKLTPRARWNLILGRQRPFDRHDWVIDRCGQQVEYVIDYYTGKANPLIPDMPSFYLDVRPKLNSVEGIRMRLIKFFGL